MESKSMLELAREGKGLAQHEIADRLKVTQATVSHWEGGVTAPHPRKWPRIARVYGVSVAALLDYFSGKGRAA